MTTKREDLDHVRLGRPQPRSRRSRKCYACAADAVILCDHPKELPDGMTLDDLGGVDEEFRLKLTTCSRPCCGRHGCWWSGRKHLCQEHAKQVGVWA